MNHILNGKSKLVLVKNGKVTIKNILKNDTHHLIDEDIFLNLSSCLNSVSVSCKNAEVFPVEKASAHNDISADQIRKYQKLSQIIYIKLEINKQIFAITIVVLFHNLSPIIPAGIWKTKEIAYHTAV